MFCLCFHTMSSIVAQVPLSQRNCIVHCVVGEKQRTESPESSDGSSLLSRGAVAGVSVAGVISILAIAVAIAAIAFLISRKKTLPSKRLACVCLSLCLSVSTLDTDSET